MFFCIEKIKIIRKKIRKKLFLKKIKILIKK